MAKKQWIDASSRNFNLVIRQEFDEGILENQVLAAIPDGKLDDDVIKTLEDIGFTQHDGIFTTTEPLRKIMPMIGKNIPGMKPCEREQSDIIQKVDVAVNVEPVKEIRGYLGENSLGHKVYADDAGVRYFQPSFGNPMYENSSSMSPGSFLRVTTPRDMVSVTDALVKSIKSGTRYDDNDFLFYARVIYDDSNIQPGDNRLALLRSGIEDAVMKSLLSDTKDKGNLLSDIFRISKGLQENIQFNNGAIPSPLAASIARMIGMEDFKGKEIVLSGIESSSIYGLMPNEQIKIYPNTGFDELIKNNVSVTRRNRSRIMDGSPDFKGADITLSVIDHIESIEKTLGERKADGRSAFILRGDEDIKNIMDRLSREYNVEGIINVEGNLYSGHADSSGMKIISIGPKLKTPLSSPNYKIENADTYDQVWSWALNTTIERAKHMETVDNLEDMSPDDVDGPPDDNRNAYQVPYVPLSKIGKATKMIPRNLDESTRHALAEIGKRHPDVDKWVGEELRMTKEELAQRFLPEQIDAIAMIIDCEERGKKGAALTDQMGVGKGRVIAAMLWRAHLTGKKPIFMTEKPLNLSDIVRDLRQIGVVDKMRILIMNPDQKAINETDNSIALESPDRETLTKIMETQRYPDDYDLVLGSYSLFNRNGDEPRILQRNKQAEDGSYIKNGKGYVQEDYLEADTRTPQTIWIRKAITPDVYMVLDESHVAAGKTGNIAKNIESAKKACGFTMYSSATYSANSKNMSLYSNLIPPSVDMEELEETLKKGGETFQETLASMMIKDGVMRRCEPDAGDVDLQIIMDEERTPYYEKMMDTLSPILGNMAMLSGDMDSQIKTLNRIAIEDADKNLLPNETEDEHKERMKSLQITRMGFNSPLHTISKLFLMCLMSNTYAENAIECLQNGQKPVIQVDNTVQTILDEIYETQKENDEDIIPDFKDVLRRQLHQLTHSTKWDSEQKKRVPLDMAAENPEIEAIWNMAHELLEVLPDSITQADKQEQMDHSDKRKEMIDYLETIAGSLDIPKSVEKKAVKELKKIIQNFPDDAVAMAPYVRNMHLRLPFNFHRRVNEIRAMIEAMPSLHLSAIDVVRDRIEAAGYKCGEVTGRTKEVRDGKVVRRKVPNPISVINAFNNGESNAIIISKSASTGVSMHSDENFKDQGQRVYMPMQMIEDPKKQRQAEGRTSRTGQVNTPIIRIICSGLASEKRLLAMYNTKSRRISASTTSNRDHSTLIDGIPDIMNAIGDKIVPEYFEARPDLMKRMCMKSENLFDGIEKKQMAKIFTNSNVKVPNAEEPRAQRGRGRRKKKDEDEVKVVHTVDEDTQDSRRKASEFFARLILLPCAQAKKIIDEIMIEYEAVKKELEDRGETPLKPKMIDGKVFLRDKYIVDGIESDNLKTEFDRPVYAQNIVIKRMIEPLRSEQVINMVERGMAMEANENPDEIADNIERHKEQMLKPLLPDDAVDIADAIARYPDSGLVLQNNKLDAVITCLRQLRAGKEIQFQLEAGDSVSGLVERIIIPNESHQHIPQAYKAVILVPGQAKPINISISSLIYDEMFEIKDGYHGEDAGELIKKFDEAGEASKLEARTILVGNEWLALNMAVKHKLGSMTMFEDDKGIRRRGILVLKKHTKLKHVPATMPDVNMCDDFMSSTDVPAKNKTIYLNNNNENSFSISMVSPQNVEFRLPGTTSSLYPKLMATDIFKDIVEKSDMKPKSAFRFTVPVDRMKPYLKILMDLGVRPQVSSASREWVNKWRHEHYNTPENNNNADMKLKA